MTVCKAIIFDFDGTLVDSEMLHFMSWNKAIEGFDIALTKDDYFTNFVGIPALGNAELILSRHALNTSPRDLVQAKESALLNLAEHVETPFMPFAKELLTILAKNKIPMSIVSGSHREDIMRIVKRTNITHYFQDIISFDDVTISKPDPEGYLRCAKNMGYLPSEYIVFEDTATGTLAAKRAGLTCFAVQHEAKYHQALYDAGADMVFLGLEEAFHYLRSLIANVGKERK